MAKYDDSSWHYNEFSINKNVLTHIGMFLNWCIDNNLISEELKNNNKDDIENVKKRIITGTDFFIKNCDEKFFDEDLNELGNEFTSDYYESDTMFGETHSTYLNDYFETFGNNKTTTYIEDSWENYGILKEKINKAFDEWKKYKKNKDNYLKIENIKKIIGSEIIPENNENGLTFYIGKNYVNVIKPYLGKNKEAKGNSIYFQNNNGIKVFIQLYSEDRKGSFSILYKTKTENEFEDLKKDDLPAVFSYASELIYKIMNFIKEGEKCFFEIDNSKLTKQAKEFIKKEGAFKVWNSIKDKLKNSINIYLDAIDEDKIKIGQSKIGGFPDLPKNVNWFTNKEKPLSFLAQINLEEIKNYDLDNKLPNEGILYFFYDAEEQPWGLDLEDKLGSKVFYFNGNIKELERKEKPDNLDKELCFNSCKLSFNSVLNIPDYSSDIIEDGFSNKESDDYSELFEIIDKDYTITKLLGHSNNIQNGMENDCEFFRNGMENGYSGVKNKELEKNNGLWNLLFQLDSEDESGMMWGDSGSLYFWIRENDLEEKNFENCINISQCY